VLEQNSEFTKKFTELTIFTLRVTEPSEGCPGRLWSLFLWRYSRPAWTRSCAACYGWPCFGRGVGL